MRLSALLLTLLVAGGAHAGPFRVLPYLQNPSRDGITVRWLSEKADAGVLTVKTPGGALTLRSEPALARALAPNPFGEEPGGPHRAPPYLHRVRVTGLRPGTRYDYAVRQGDQEHRSAFRTAPDRDRPVRFIVYSDCETEPESSTTDPVDWPPSPGSNRPRDVTRYFVNQTVGYRENLKVVAARRPDFVAIAGDLVETGGKQRDWDEFWRHNAGDYGTIAGSVPIFPALGNHENFAGPGALGGYDTTASNFATAKYLAYFEVPKNDARDRNHEGRYYRIDYGPVTLITLDTSDGRPADSARDTNHNITGSHAPDFNPGSAQYRWLEAQLKEARKTSRFTFVQFHHVPYGSGPHSVPMNRPGFTGQAGIPTRVLLPLLGKHGVAAVFCGHDEMLERSEVPAEEALPDGGTRKYVLHVYDVGIAGDGLRGPSVGADNPYRKYLAHADAPEKWRGRQLLTGGKHYGHVEVNVERGADGAWEATITPVAVFPLTDEKGAVVSWERRPYDDVVVVTAGAEKREGRSGLAVAGLMVLLAALGVLLQRFRRASANRSVCS
jgi:3',5'-cyclic AMP phosphodiesterase CpdA